jgi:dihydroorotate dehydrogenase
LSLYPWIRRALFQLDAERAHNLTIAALSAPFADRALAIVRPALDSPRLRQQVFGLSFPHPVGLAAGLDKQGTAIAAWDALGFGSAEIGTVTPRPQPGNPQPRLFRLPDDLAIINRFGFNSAGAPQVAANLAAARRRRSASAGAMRLGINIGKNRDTPNDRAADDYRRAVDVLHPFADYFVVNVSSPNTKGLRDLQESRALRALLGQVVHQVAAATARPIPVLVKVAPDMAADDLRLSVDAAIEGGAAGIIATNTTVSRDGLRTRAAIAGEAGGLSGAPLRARANDACRTVFRHLGRRVPIIGVGGVFDADDVYERIRSGASLVQIYTALVYEGPGLVARLARGLDERLARDGFTNVQEAIGIDVQ